MVKMKGFEFYTLKEQTLIDSPVMPIKEVLVPWKREAVDVQKKQEGRKSRTDICSGIIKQNQLGWIVSCWADMKVSLNREDNSIFVTVPSKEKDPFELLDGPPINVFPPLSFSGFARTLKGTYPSLLKINTPWRFRCPDGWGLMYCPLLYHNQVEFYSATGVLDPTFINELNALLFLHTDKEELTIRQGTPLFQIVPVPLNQPKSIVREASEKEKKWHKMVEYMVLTRFKLSKKKVKENYDKFFSRSKRNV